MTQSKKTEYELDEELKKFKDKWLFIVTMAAIFTLLAICCYSIYVGINRPTAINSLMAILGLFSGYAFAKAKKNSS